MSRSRELEIICLIHYEAAAVVVNRHALPVIYVLLLICQENNLELLQHYYV